MQKSHIISKQKSELFYKLKKVLQSCPIPEISDQQYMSKIVFVSDVGRDW